MSDLESFQRTVAKVLTGLSAAHVPMLAVICALLGGTLRQTLLPALPLPLFR